MPRVHTFAKGFFIAIYADHAPPHFHFYSPNSSAMVDIRTLEVIRGRCDRRDLATVRQWAERNVAFLEAEWERLNGRA